MNKKNKSNPSAFAASAVLLLGLIEVMRCYGSLIVAPPRIMSMRFKSAAQLDASVGG